MTMEKWAVGVFTSIDAGLGLPLDIAKEIGVQTIQMHAPARTTRTEQQARQMLDTLAQYEIELTAVFGGFDGESYADIPTVERTVGLVPSETRAERLDEMKHIADYARWLNCSVLGLHIGFVPHDTESSLYRDVIAVTQDLCHHCRGNNQALHLETGQEPVDGLLKFIDDSECDNLFVNFDPANMILYGTGEPLEALRKIGGLVRSVHCKDATWSDQPGVTWGEEFPLGEGQVDIEKYLRILNDIGYAGPLTIEREIPQEPERQKSEIGGAVRLLNELRAKLGAV